MSQVSVVAFCLGLVISAVGWVGVILGLIMAFSAAKVL